MLIFIHAVCMLDARLTALEEARDGRTEIQIAGRELSAIGRRARGRRSSSSTATWSTAGSGTGSSTALADRFRCIAPTCRSAPRGARWRPTRPHPPGVATIIDDFLAALGLEDVTLVGNDSGGADVARCSSPAAPPGSAASSSPTATPTRTSRRGSSRRCRRSPSCPAACGRWRSRSGSRRSPAPPSPPSPRTGPPDDLVADWTGAAAARPGDHARPRQGHRAAWTSATRSPPRQSLRGIRIPPPARLGARRPLLPDPLRRTPCRRSRRRETGRRYPIRRPSYRSISPKRLATAYRRLCAFAVAPSRTTVRKIRKVQVFRPTGG